MTPAVQALRRNSAVTLGVLGAALVVLIAFAKPVLLRYDDIGYVALLFVVGGIALLAQIIVGDQRQRSILVIIIAVAVAARVVSLFHEPLLTTDIYRYVWDGRVQGAGINPYRYVPADDALSALRDAAIYPSINRADYAHTAYPPFAQMFFFFATRIADSLDGMRVALTTCEAASLFLLARLIMRMGLSPARIVGAAWHPLAISEIASDGHVDALVMLLVMAGVFLLIAGPRLIGVAFVACAILVKPYAAVLLPAFWRRWDWRAPLLVLLLIAALYAPYTSVGTAVIGFVPGYAKEEGLANGDLFWLVHVVRHYFGEVPGLLPAYAALALGCIAWQAVVILRKPATYDPARQFVNAMVLLALGIFFFSPNYPWYYVPLVPLVALGGAPAWAMTVGALFLHVSWPGADQPAIRFLVWKSVMNGLLLLTLAWTALRHRRAEITSKTLAP